MLVKVALIFCRARSTKGPLLHKYESILTKQNRQSADVGAFDKWASSSLLVYARRGKIKTKFSEYLGWIKTATELN